ncbi:unnamed protein product, partial [Rotaria sordida]
HSPTTVRNLTATPSNVYQEMRPISECINALIHDSNAKIMKFLLKYTSTPMDDQELYKLICEQHKKLQQQLHQILSSSSSSTQQQPTSFGAL